MARDDPKEITPNPDAGEDRAALQQFAQSYNQYMDSLESQHKGKPKIRWFDEFAAAKLPLFETDAVKNLETQYLTLRNSFQLPDLLDACLAVKGKDKTHTALTFGFILSYFETKHFSEPSPEEETTAPMPGQGGP